MFGANQRRYLFNQLRYIDELLSDAARELELAPSGRMFAKVLPDASLVQRRTLRDFLEQLRFVLRRFMDANDLHDERVIPSGLWAFRTALTFARVAAQELRPRYLAGYGPVDPAGADHADRLAAELISLLGRIDQYLVRGDDKALEERLSQLEAQSDEGRLLRELTRIVSTYGLTELRGSLERLIDRAAAPRFEMALFGRVSSGKSSLLNWWLEQPLLPTGVTPVTAVPTHITHGTVPRACLTIAHSPTPVEIAIDALSAYITEKGNPGNRKEVLEVLIQVPAQRLQSGIYLVDTPGLGSLASAGALQTLDYLPRCDLGVLLIEAGAPVGREEIAVVRALRHAGSDLLVLASKADRLSAPDLAGSCEYVRSQFESELGVSLDVRPVSTIGEQAEFAARWFDQAIAPRISSFRKEAIAALKRKIGVLRESVVAVLDTRLASSSDEPGTTGPHSTSPPESPFHRPISEMRAELERATSQLPETGRAYREIGPKVLDAAQEELARSWFVADSTTITSARVTRTMQRVASEPGDALTLMLCKLHGDAAALLRRAGQPTTEALAAPRGRPVLELSLPASPGLYRMPRCLPPLLPLARLAASARLSPALTATLHRQLSIHGEALARWAREYLDGLASHFNVSVGALESIERFSSGTSLELSERPPALEDIDLLRNWPSSSV